MYNKTESSPPILAAAGKVMTSVLNIIRRFFARLIRRKTLRMRKALIKVVIGPKLLEVVFDIIITAIVEATTVKSKTFQPS